MRAAAGEVTTTVVVGSYLIVKIGSDWILRSRGEIFLIEFTLFNTFKLFHSVFQQTIPIPQICYCCFKNIDSRLSCI